jgi:hypothetical protein
MMDTNGEFPMDTPQGGAPVDLSSFDDEYTGTEEKDRDDVPDGKYQVVVDRVELTRAKSSGNPMLRWTLRILAPRYTGRLLWRNSVIKSGNCMRWFKTDLKTCGLELERLSDLDHYLSKLVGVALEITQKTIGENENIYFNRRIEIDASAMAPRSAAPGGADDLPF